MVHFLKISSSNARDFSSLTYSNLRDKLVHIDTTDSTFAIGAAIFKKPVGMVLALVNQPSYRGTIESLYVVNNYRDQGIGTTLMRMIEEQLAQKGCKELQLNYRKPDDVEDDVIERIIRKGGWEKPKDVNTLFKLKDWQKVLDASWANVRMPSSCQVFRWCDLGNEDMRRLKEDEKRVSNEEEYFSPFVEADFDSDSSLGLRYNGQVIGWMITRRLSQDVIAFSNLYVKKDFQGRIFGPLILAESIRIAHDNKIPKAIFVVRNANKRMLGLSNRHLKKFSYEIRLGYNSVKILKNTRWAGR